MASRESILKIKVEGAEDLKSAADLSDKFNLALDSIAQSSAMMAIALDKAWDKSAKGIDKPTKKISSFERQLKRAGRGMDQLVTKSAAIAKNIASAGLNAAKWGLLAGAGIGGAGMFGFGAFAGGIGNARKQAQGLGVGTGELDSAAVHLTKVFDDATKTLADIAASKGDVANWQLSRITGKGRGELSGMSSGEIMADMLPKLKRVVDSIPASQMSSSGVLKSKGLEGFSLGELQRIRQMSEQEIKSAADDFKKGIKSLAVPDDINKKYQDTAIQFDKASKEIETSFKRLLVELNEPIKGLSDVISKDIRLAVDSGKAAEAVKLVSKKLTEAVKYLTSDAAQKDLERFGGKLVSAAEGVEKFVDKVNGVLQFLGLKKDETVPADTKMHTPLDATVTIAKSAASGFFDELKTNAKSSWLFKPIGGTNEEIAKKIPQGVKDGYDYLASFVSKGEGGYTSANRGTHGGKILVSTLDLKGLDKMTIGEVKAQQAEHVAKHKKGDHGKGLFAVGRYQFIPGSLEAAQKGAGLKDTDMFSPENQDKLFKAFVPKRARDYIEGRSKDHVSAADAMAATWASIPDPLTGRSKYGHGNKAGHSVPATFSALAAARDMQQTVKGKIANSQYANNSKTDQSPGQVKRPSNQSQNNIKVAATQKLIIQNKTGNDLNFVSSGLTG